MNPHVPEVLGQITAKAMAKSPEDRFQSAEAMAQALESANQFVTNQLSASLPGNLLTSVQNTTLQSQNLPISPTPSYYNTQSPPVSNGAAVHQQQPSHYGMTPPYGSSPRITNPGSAGLIKPTAKRSKSKTSITYIAFALVLLLAVGLLLAKQGVIPGLNSSQNSGSPTATAFIENFQSTTRNWTAGTIGGLTTGIVKNQYDIQMSGGPDASYFPHPDVGTLPTNFTLTASMEQTQGSNAWFGLAFREKDDGKGGHVTCYAFGIQTNGGSTVQKYDPSCSKSNNYHRWFYFIRARFQNRKQPVSYNSGHRSWKYVLFQSR